MIGDKSLQPEVASEVCDFFGVGQNPMRSTLIKANSEFADLLD